MERNERIGLAAQRMRTYVEQGQTFRTGAVKRVPARSYTDPDQWKAELELVFRRLPLMLAFTAELPRPGDYKAMDVIGLPVLINRDKAGTVRAFLNVCRRLWQLPALFLQVSRLDLRSGRTADRHIRCEQVRHGRQG